MRLSRKGLKGLFRKKTILLVNSSQVFMDITKKILERTGYSVLCATSLAEARTHLINSEPDGIVLENDLPEIEGLDYCRELRMTCAVPIMFLSNSKNDELQALQAGATDFLKKPFDYDVLKARIGVMLNNKSAATAENSAENAAAAKKPRRIYMSIEACVTVIFVGIGVLVYISNANYTANIPPEYPDTGEEQFVILEDPEIPLAVFEFPEAQPVALPEIADFTVAAGTTGVDIPLYNPESNSCLMTFEIILTDTGETIFLSEPAEPGAAAGAVTLAKPLAAGSYGAVVKIDAYAPEGPDIIYSAEIPVRITAG